jgi:membrane protein
MNMKRVASLFKEAGLDWVEDKAARLGAALAYYTIFSLAPLLVIVIGVAGLIFGPDGAETQVVGQIEKLVGEQGGEAIRSMIESARKPGARIVGSVLGIVMLLLGAAGLFGQLQDALNTIWEVQPKPGRGLWGFIRDRFLSFTMVLGSAFLLVTSLVVSAAIAAVMELLGGWQNATVGHLVNEAVSLTVFTLLFAMIYRYLPDAKIAWRDVWLGAGLTALLFEAGKFLIGLYLGHAGVASAYGAAGSLAILLVWVYYSAQIFLFGAELTQVYANAHGSRILPNEHAVHISGEQRAAQGIHPEKGMVGGST